MDIGRFVPKKEMARRLGVGDTTLWRMWRDGIIPPPQQISARRVGWTEEVARSILNANRDGTRQRLAKLREQLGDQRLAEGTAVAEVVIKLTL